MRIIGLDVGTRTIGVAASDPLGMTAQGVETIRRSDLESDLLALEKIVSDYQAEMLLVGLPLNMNGSEGPSVEMAREFGSACEARFPLPVVYRDERLSTVAAERYLLEADISRKKRKQVIDKMAAVYVLQGYLDQLEMEKRAGARETDQNDGFKLGKEIKMADILTLIDEDGKEIEFAVECFLDVEDKSYAVLIPQDAEEEDEAVIMRLGKDENGEDVLFDIDDDEEWDKVAEYYESMEIENEN